MTREQLASVRVQRRLSHPPEDVWAALTDPAEVMEWMRAQHAYIDGRVGGYVDLRAHEPITGRILAWDPPHLFEHEVQVPPSKVAPAGEDAILRYELRRDGDGCLLTMSLTRLSATSARNFSKGLETTLDRLEAHLGRKNDTA